MTNFVHLNKAMKERPKGTGLSMAMITSVPHTTVVLARNEHHAKILQGLSVASRRGDVKFVVPGDDNLLGLDANLVPDHHTLDGWIEEAAALQEEVEKLRKEAAALQEEVEKLRKELAAAKKEDK